MPLLDIRSLSKSYGKVQVLKDVSFTVEPGQIVALVGSNGTGKSTLMKVLARQELPDSGDALVGGLSINDDDPQFNSQIAYVSEQIDIAVFLPMFEVAKMFAEAYPSWDWSAFHKLTKLFNLPVDREFNAVSRGQKMQFLFSVACASKPKLLILDEITAVLDPHIRKLAVEHLQECAAGGTAILISTNILTEVQDRADRFIFLDDGFVAHNLDRRSIEKQDLFSFFTKKAG